MNESSSISLSLVEGETRLLDVIESFAREVEEYSSSTQTNAPQLAIKATAGLGKTTQIIKKLIASSALKNGHVHYYVPTHRLSSELQDELSKVLDFPMTQAQEKGPIYNRSIIIAGRNQRDSHGHTLCQKSNVTEQAAKAGINIEKNFCKNENNTCEFYDSCAYQNQFELYDKGMPEYWPKELDNYVTVMTHANLFLQTNKRLPKPTLIVVDEAFYQTGISEVPVSAIELYKGKHPISTALLSHLTDKGGNLLAKVRELGYSVENLLDEADLIDDSHSDDNQNNSLSPSLASNQQQRLIEELITKKRASLILRAIAQEMTITDRDECHSVSYDDNEDQVIIHGRKELTISEDVPTVFIDADVQEDILSKYRANVKFEKIPVERLATFHQVIDLTFNKLLLLNSGNKTNKIQDDIKRFIHNIALEAPTLVVCSKAIRAALTNDNSNKMEQESQLEGATIIHFGNLRGLNEYSNYRNVIILGREQPSAVGVENSARGLFWDDKESIKFLSLKGKHKPFEDEERVYRLKDKTTKKVSVRVHPDKRVQLLLEQIRENETVQAIDRLRLLRPHKDGQRNVYILSSVPLDLTIDNLFSWTQLQKLAYLLDEAKGVIPLNPKHLMKRCPESATSKSTAERMIANLKDLNPLIRLYIREMRLFSVDYRIKNKGRYSKALISNKVEPTARDAILSLLLDTDDIEIRESSSDND